MTVQVANASDHPLRIPSKLWSFCYPYLGFDVRLLDERGKEPEKGLAGDCFALGPPPDSVEQLRTQSLLLMPGSFLGARTIVHTGIYRNLKPGSYSIVATYRSWRQSDFKEADMNALKGMKAPVLVGQINKAVSVRLKR